MKKKKKASKKKSVARKKAAPKKARRSTKSASAPARSSKRQLVNKQPQSKLQAAAAKGMFLYTDDAWSLRYFDQKDLHCIEREVFG